MTKINTKYILLLGIILTLFAAGNDTNTISLEQADVLRSTSREKTIELKKLTQLEATVNRHLFKMMQQRGITQNDAVALETLNNHAVSIRIMKLSLKNNHWQNWKEKKYQVSQLIYRTKERI